MEEENDDRMDQIHNHNSSRTQQQSRLSVGNEHLKFESALSEGPDLKIDISKCKSTCKSVRIFRGCSQNTRLRRVKPTPVLRVRSPVAKNNFINNNNKNNSNNNNNNISDKVNHSIYFINNVHIKGGKQEIGEPKNEILSRTIFPFTIRNLIRISFYFLVVCLMLNGGLEGVESVPVKTSHQTALINLNKEYTNNNRTLLYPGARMRNQGRRNDGDSGGVRNRNQWLVERPRLQHNNNNNNHHHHHHHHYHHQQHFKEKHNHYRHQQEESIQRQENSKYSVNKNCKEYDVTSRAFLSDLVFEGTARSRSRRASGRYVTFVVQRILKQKNNLIRPKTQIRLHFGGRRNSRRLSRINPLHDCPINSISNGRQAMVNLKVGENYYVFADQFGLMNYTARGEPIVANKRNLKSIRSVLSKKKERPPRVLGLKDMNLQTTQALRLNCQVRGRPVPRINWYKNGASLIPSPRVNITYHRRNSTVEIKLLELEDGGMYECRATSVTGKTAKMSAHVNVWKPYASSTEDPNKPVPTKKCSVDAYCLNGGQCYFIEHLGEHMCECEAGYKGQRCEVKDVPSGIKSYVCGFNVGYSSYYC